ncbi:MAG TPA: hypothetical protein VL989_02480 [Candidatus Sulfotelmatobacter sp.]|nr:hypothetical protein [Candidatus Sulfotelmatobacter sp.]
MERIDTALDPIDQGRAHGFNVVTGCTTNDEEGRPYYSCRLATEFGELTAVSLGLNGLPRNVGQGKPQISNKSPLNVASYEATEELLDNYGDMWQMRLSALYRVLGYGTLCENPENGSARAAFIPSDDYINNGLLAVYQQMGEDSAPIEFFRTDETLSNGEFFLGLLNGSLTIAKSLQISRFLGQTHKDIGFFRFSPDIVEFFQDEVRCRLGADGLEELDRESSAADMSVLRYNIGNLAYHLSFFPTHLALSEGSASTYKVRDEARASLLFNILQKTIIESSYADRGDGRTAADLTDELLDFQLRLEEAAIEILGESVADSFSSIL